MSLVSIQNTLNNKNLQLCGTLVVIGSVQFHRLVVLNFYADNKDGFVIYFLEFYFLKLVKPGYYLQCFCSGRQALQIFLKKS